MAAPRPKLGIVSGYASGEDSWDVDMNANLNRLDSLVMGAVKDKDLNTPPGSPADGDRYIVGPSPSGAWNAKAGQVTAWESGPAAWKFYPGTEGWHVWVEDEKLYYTRTASAWVADLAVVNVAMYATFQAAHDALPSSGGKIIVPAGTFTHSTVPAWGSGSTPGMIITKEPVIVVGAGSYATVLRNSASGANNQHGFDIRANTCQISHLMIDGVGSAGTGNHIKWNKAGTNTQLTCEDLVIEQSPSYGFFGAPQYGQFMSKIYFTKVNFAYAKSGGDVFIGGSGSSVDNSRFYGCEFSSSGTGGYQAVGSTWQGNGITLATGTPHLTRTVANGGLTMIANGDECRGSGIPVGATVTGLQTAVDPHTANLSITPTGSGFRSLVFQRSTVGATQVPIGSVHLCRCTNIRFHSCSWQGEAATVGLSIEGPSSTINLVQCYREYGTPFTSPQHFMVTQQSVENFAVDHLFMQTSTADPKFLKTGSLVNDTHSVQNARFRGIEIVTNQNPPTLTNLIDIGSTWDDVEFSDIYSISSATGLRYPIIIGGAGAGFRALASVAGTMTLSSPTVPVFSLTGTNAVTSITAQHRGRVVTLVTSSTASLTNGSNLKLNSNWAPAAANHSITLLSDGTNWIEIGRS